MGLEHRDGVIREYSEALQEFAEGQRKRLCLDQVGGGSVGGRRKGEIGRADPAEGQGRVLQERQWSR